MLQKRVSQFFKQKETTKIIQKQTLIDTLCKIRPSHVWWRSNLFNPRKKVETECPVERPRKYDNNISVKELHDFNDLLEFDRWYNEKYSKLYTESTEPKTTWKRFSFQKKEESIFIWPVEIIKKQQEHFNLGFHCL